MIQPAAAAVVVDIRVEMIVKAETIMAVVVVVVAMIMMIRMVMNRIRNENANDQACPVS